MAVLWTFREPSLGRHVHRELLRNAWLDFAPRLPATACHQRHYVETYSRDRVFEKKHDRECTTPVSVLPLTHIRRGMGPDRTRSHAMTGTPVEWLRLAARITEELRLRIGPRWRSDGGGEQPRLTQKVLGQGFQTPQLHSARRLG